MSLVRGCECSITPDNGFLNTNNTMAKRFTATSYLIRLVSSFLLVCASYNPIKPYSYYEWAIAPALYDVSQLTVLHGLAGIVLLIGWVIFLRATSRSLGFFGILLATAFFTMLIWFFVDKGWVSLEGNQSLTWVILAAVSAVLATGLSWSHIRRRITGQLDVDEADDH
ncbi:MAG: hypothetical protein ACI9J2_000424 [Saprospiraceae bacterium]|jgi:hypothetical protein